MRGVRQMFDFSAAFVVSSAFVYAGTPYLVDAPFPHKELGVTEYDMAILWTANKVDVVPNTSTASASTPSSAKQQGRRDKR